VLGDKWSELIPILPILAFGGVARALGTALGSLFKATGDTNLSFRMESVRAITLGIGLVACIIASGGLKFIAFAFLVSVALKTLVAFYYCSYRYASIVNMLYGSIPTLISSILMCFVIYVLSASSLFGVNYINLSFIVLSCSVLYLAIHFYIERLFEFRVVSYLFRNLIDKVLVS
jgi:O-antigen/teichoic acid export membrane protein